MSSRHDIVHCFQRWLRRVMWVPIAGLLLAAAGAQAQSSFTQTRYPIVLVHGLFGFDSAWGIDYFYGIPEALRQGGAQVHVAQVSAVNSTAVRGEQLLAQVQTIVALTGLPKVHLIGHSHGGLTARYVAAVAPELVASVTTIGSPHKGSRLADLLRTTLPAGSVPEAVVSRAAQALMALLQLFSTGRDLPQSPSAALDAFTTIGLQEFNRRFPQAVPSDCGNGAELVEGVRYYSWSGVQRGVQWLEVDGWIFGLLGRVFDEPNDGLVSACSSRLGTYLGDYAQNHLEEINQLFGMRRGTAPDPVVLYREHAHRLQRMGL